MHKKLSLTLLSSLFWLSACSKESPELIPCMCDPNAESTLGIFDCMCESSKNKPVRRISYIQDNAKVRYKSLIINDEQKEAYSLLHKSRDFYAPIKLENVDFRIKKSHKYDEFQTKLGNYHFRLFGCRRETKNAYLNQGRSMQKDMHFFNVFYETLNDYYPVVVDPSNVYYHDSDKLPHPEYIITAEITDYFMNICDEFDWEEAQNKKLRTGSSEITVVWRVMNLSKDEVYCKGTTTGYGQVAEGEPNGETLLVERAFEDALTKLPEISCLNETLSQRVCPADIAAQLAALTGKRDCVNCFDSQYADELAAINMLQECDHSVQMTPVCGEADASCQSAINEENITIVDDCQTAEINNETIVKNEQKLSPGEDYFVDIPLEIDAAKSGEIVEDGGSSATGTNIEINEVDENSFASVNNNFCIENNPPFEDLDPHNLYKLRASMVMVENSAGQKGSGIIIADNMVLTSADLIQKDNNKYNLKTVNGRELKASAFRVNPTKNVAVLMLEEPTKYQPLPLVLELPEVNKDILMTLGLLNLDEDGENYLDNEGRVTGYRWTEERGAEILVDTFVQSVSLGGALIDQRGNIIGISHEASKEKDSQDLFIPIETALKSLGLEICNYTAPVKPQPKPKAVKIITPIADAIENNIQEAPKPVEGLKRK